MKNLKMLFLFCITIFAISCKKEPQPIITQPQCCVNMAEIGYTDAQIYLIDFDTMSVVDAQGNVIGTDNGNGYPYHFTTDINGNEGYALTKSKGQTLDSIPLRLFGNTAMNLMSNFDFVGGYYPTQVDSLKINKFNQTTLEIYSGGVKIGSALVGEYGFYGDPTDYVVSAFTSLHPTRTNRICIRM